MKDNTQLFLMLALAAAIYLAVFLVGGTIWG